MVSERRRISKALAATGMAVAVMSAAGCSSTPPAGPSIAVPSASPAFVNQAGINVAYVEFNNSAFPYRGNIPASKDNGPERPFLEVDAGGKLVHTSPRGGVNLENGIFDDRRVLIAAGTDFNAHGSGVIVVYFHGNRATLQRDVMGRQQVARQVASSGINGVLVAPQMAVDAADSSAGKFWTSGGFADFLSEAETRLAELYPRVGSGAFRRMPVIVVAYSGGYLPAAYSLERGGAGDRVRGVIMFDAAYGEDDKFVDWVERARGRAFFVSAYSRSTRSGNEAIRARLQQDGVAFETQTPATLTSNTIAFIDAGDVSHDDFVTSAWTTYPLRDLLTRMR